MQDQIREFYLNCFFSAAQWRAGSRDSAFMGLHLPPPRMWGVHMSPTARLAFSGLAATPQLLMIGNQAQTGLRQKKKKNRKQWTVLAQGTEESKVLAPGITWACLSVSFSSLPRGRGNIISSPPTTERECLPPHPSPREVSREPPLA